MRLRTLLFVGFCVVMLAVVARSLRVAHAFKKIVSDYTQLVETHDRARRAAARVGNVAVDLETGVRGWSITRDRAFLEPYDRAIRERDAAFAELSALVASDPVETELVARIRAAVEDWDDEVARPAIASSSKETDIALANEGKHRMDAIRGDVRELERLLVASAAVDASKFEERRAEIVSQDLVSGLIVLLALIAVVAVLVRSLERPLHVLADHADRMERPPPGLRGVAEVRTLAAAMSRMVGQLFAQRERDQRFAALMASLAAGGSTHEVSELALRSLLEDQNAVAGALWLRREGGSLELAASVGLDRDKLSRDATALADEALRTNRTLRMNTLAEEHGWQVRSACLEARPRSLVVAPIAAGSVPVGAVELAGIEELDSHSVERALARIGLALQNTVSAERTAQLARDVSEQRTRFKSVFESLTEMVYLFDVDGICRISNPAADASLGGSAVGMTFEQLRVRHRAAMADGSPVPPQASAAEGRPLRNALRQITDANGKVRIVSMTSALLNGPTGRLGTVISARDVTEEHELRDRLALLNEELRAQNEELRAQEEELRTQGQELIQRQTALSLRNEQLTRATRHKSAFLATMSHELRTPLNAVIGFTDLLLDDPDKALSEQQRAWVADVNAAGTHLLTLINDILDLSRIEAGHIELTSTTLDLAEPVQSATSLTRTLAQQRGVQLDDATTPGTLMVYADRARVRQVMVNLLSNAIKFTPQGGAVSIRAEVEPQYVRVRVVDSGIGIDPAQAHRLFQPFSQLETGAQRRFGGTGLGLSISKQLVEKMGGEIGFTSTLGAGATFWFTLPRSDTTTSPTPPQPSRAAERVTPPPRVPVSPPSIHPDVRAVPATDRPTVLVVEDAGPDAEIVATVVSRAGYAVMHATTAEEALSTLETSAASLLIVDLGLPGMSGTMLLERVRAMPGRERLPMIVLTARDIDSAERARIGLSTAHVIRKGSLSRNALVSLLHELCPPMGIPVANDVAPKNAPLRVLVVDDNHMNRRVLRSMLVNFGCEVIEAVDGPTAVELATKELPALVLMDIQMPGMDGMEATRVLQKNLVTKAIPVVAVTAHAMQGDAERFLDAGCVGYVSKPVARTALASAVDQALGRSTWRQLG
jgi:PAS domain S-box-containing protein